MTLYMNNGQSKCPLCNASVIPIVFGRSRSGSSNFGFQQIYPSKGNNDDESEECTKLKNELDEAKQKVASLQSKLNSTENTLNSSRQEHGIALSKLEGTVETIARLKMDNEQLKKSNNEYVSSIEKLKTSCQIVANTLSRSPSTNQTPREQLGLQDLFKVGKTVLSVVASDSSNSFVNQTLQRDYLDLKSNYQDAVNRERLAEVKLADLTARLQSSQTAENLQDRQRLQKQLFDTLIEQNTLSNTVTNLNLEKQRLVDEMRAVKEKYNSMIPDYKKLQDTETTWITNNRHLQELLKGSNEDLVKMKALNHDYATEMFGLKEEIKDLREANKKHDAEKLEYADAIKQFQAEIKRYEESVKALSDREVKLMEKLNVAQQPWQLFL